MRPADESPALAKFLEKLGIAEEMEPIGAYVLGFCTSSASPSAPDTLTKQVVLLLSEPHPKLKDALSAQDFSQAIGALLESALKIKDAGVAPSFGVTPSALKSKSELLDAAQGLSSCLYCFLRGLKDGLGARPVVLDAMTLKQLNQLEGAWDYLSHLVLRARKNPGGQESKIEIQSAISSCHSLWRAVFPGLVQALR